MLVTLSVGAFLCKFDFFYGLNRAVEINFFYGFLAIFSNLFFRRSTAIKTSSTPVSNGVESGTRFSIKQNFSRLPREKSLFNAQAGSNGSWKLCTKDATSNPTLGMWFSDGSYSRHLQEEAFKLDSLIFNPKAHPAWPFLHFTISYSHYKWQKGIPKGGETFTNLRRCENSQNNRTFCPLKLLGRAWLVETATFYCRLHYRDPKMTFPEKTKQKDFISSRGKINNEILIKSAEVSDTREMQKQTIEWAELIDHGTLHIGIA